MRQQKEASDNQAAEKETRKGAMNTFIAGEVTYIAHVRLLSIASFGPVLQARYQRSCRASPQYGLGQVGKITITITSTRASTTVTFAHAFSLDLKAIEPKAGARETLRLLVLEHFRTLNSIFAHYW